jgi:hypothetical protein
MANFNIDYLIVAGGGGGGGNQSATGGGGGAGGLRTSYGSSSGGGSNAENSLTFNLPTSYTITVGDGGTLGSGTTAPTNGGNSSITGSDITNVTSLGGGAADNSTLLPPQTGGSGGGGGNGSYAGASGEPNQGYAGGNSQSGARGAGGGGAANVGANSTNNNGGAGGSGLSVNILSSANANVEGVGEVSGSSVYYAGGGGGGSAASGASSQAFGGIGGGGNGELSNGNNASAGTANTGGGGGGAFTDGAKNGGSGVVILRYITADISGYNTSGSTPTEVIENNYTILVFKTVGTGTITFTTTPPPFSGTKVTTPVTDFNKTNTEEGLKIPSGTSSNQPTGFGSYTVDGMVRNDTTQSSNGSSSAITYYNGTNWRYFAATKSVDPLNPLILSSVMYYSASDTTSYPGSGTDWFDLSGNSNTATITSSNYSNGYFDLTPTASIITTPVNTLYQTFSYSIWVKFDSVTPASGYVFTMLSKNQFYASNYQAFPFYAAVAPTGTFTSNLSYGNDYSPDVTNSTSVSANTWYNIACVIDTTTNTSKLYIGTESTQLALVNSVSYTGTLVDSRNEFYSLGKAPAERSGGVGKSSMDGKIAKFGFWDTALTEAELITIWGLGSGAT